MVVGYFTVPVEVGVEGWVRGLIASFMQMTANVCVAWAMTKGYSGPIGGLIAI